MSESLGSEMNCLSSSLWIIKILYYWICSSISAGKTEQKSEVLHTMAFVMKSQHKRRWSWIWNKRDWWKTIL